MTVDHGYFHMAAQVRLKALLEMYLWGFLIALIIHTIKKKWRQRTVTQSK